jgi:hypothetical protein
MRSTSSSSSHGSGNRGNRGNSGNSGRCRGRGIRGGRGRSTGSQQIVTRSKTRSMLIQEGLTMRASSRRTGRDSSIGSSGRGGSARGNGRGGSARGNGRGNGRCSMIIPGSLQEHDSSVPVFASSTAGNEEQPGSTATVSTTITPTTTTITTTTTTKCKRTKPEDASIASVITVEDIQNSEHCLCGFLDPLCVHLQHKGTLPGNNSRTCVVCGKDCHEICGICNVAVHYTNTSPGWQFPCFFQYHNTSFFRLARSDFKIAGVKRSKFTIPVEHTLASHSKAMKELHAKVITKPNKTPSKLADSRTHQKGPVLLKRMLVLTKTM